MLGRESDLFVCLFATSRAIFLNSFCACCCASVVAHRFHPPLQHHSLVVEIVLALVRGGLEHVTGPIPLVFADLHAFEMGIDQVGLVIGPDLSNLLPPGCLPSQVPRPALPGAGRERFVRLFQQVLRFLRGVPNGREFLGDRRDLFGTRGIRIGPEACEFLLALAPGLFPAPRFLQNGGGRCLSRLKAIDRDGLLEPDPFLVLQKWILVLGGGVFRAVGLVCIGCRLLCR